MHSLRLRNSMHSSQARTESSHTGILGRINSTRGSSRYFQFRISRVILQTIPHSQLHGLRSSRTYSQRMQILFGRSARRPVILESGPAFTIRWITRPGFSWEKPWPIFSSHGHARMDRNNQESSGAKTAAAWPDGRERSSVSTALSAPRLRNSESDRFLAPAQGLRVWR